VGVSTKEEITLFRNCVCRYSANIPFTFTFTYNTVPVIKKARAESTTSFIKFVTSISRDNGDAISDEEIAMMINFVFFAALTTTSIGTANMLYLAASHPQEAKKVREISSGDAPLMLAWVMEAVRFSCGFVASNRMIVKDGFEIGGYHLPEGMGVMLDQKTSSIINNEFGEYGTFNPSHFLEPQSDETKKYGILNWGYGVHLCPGKTFAIAEMRHIAYTILRQLDISTNSKFAASYLLQAPMNNATSDFKVHYTKM
jgi:cytochrome P450